MGRAIALAFAKEGAIIVPTAVIAELLAKTAKDVSELSGRPVDWFKMDVTKKDQIAQNMQSVVDKYGRIDVLVNNAGGLYHEPRSSHDRGTVGLLHELERKRSVPGDKGRGGRIRTLDSLLGG